MRPRARTITSPIRTAFLIVLPVALLPLLAATLSGCSREDVERPDTEQITRESQMYRSNLTSYMREHPSSPFNSGIPIAFTPLRWFPVDPEYYFLAKLIRHDAPDTVAVAGTGGEMRRQLRYGYFPITIDGDEVRLNVYKFTGEDVRRHPNLAKNLSIWFTDETTGQETYEVGRYLDIEPEHDDPDHLYVINLNNAHNPFCAYNASYSCAIPTREDHIAAAVRAGELRYDAGH